MDYGSVNFDEPEEQNETNGTSIQELREKATVRKVKQPVKEEDDDEEEEKYIPKKKSKFYDKIYSKIPEKIKEPLLLLLIYIVFSLPFIRQAIGNNIKYINPNDDGDVPFIGVVIYGAILVGTFVLLKKLFL